MAAVLLFCLDAVTGGGFADGIGLMVTLRDDVDKGSVDVEIGSLVVDCVEVEEVGTPIIVRVVGVPTHCYYLLMTPKDRKLTSELEVIP
jgi:hypothetical protein